MGTQQILLIVLSVIIVGIAIVVGIMMFNSQAYNANKQAVASEITTYGSMVVQWWKTPVSQGGGGQVEGNIDVAVIADFIGFSSADNGLENEDVGEFRITASDATVGAATVTITGVGKETKTGDLHPVVVTLVSLPDGIMTASATDAVSPFTTTP